MQPPLVALIAGCHALPEPVCTVDGAHLLVATTDYESGALAAVALDGTCLADPLATLGRDPILRTLGDRVVYADRSDGDSVRTWRFGDYARPAVEFALPPGGNTHDVARVGDTLFFARFHEPFVTVTDLHGEDRRTIDLSREADADGVPEADTFVAVGERLFLSLQRLDARDAFAPTPTGRVVELDPVALDVLRSWEVGPNPKIGAAADGGLWVASGAFFALDGAVEHLDVDTGAREVAVTEAAVGFDLTHVVEGPRGLFLMGLDEDEDEPAHVACGDTTTDVQGWPVGAVADAAGAIWGITRAADFAGHGDDAAWRLEPDACRLERLGGDFLLSPAAVTVVPGPG